MKKAQALPAGPVKVGVRKHDGIVPQSFTSRADYHRQYIRNYNARFRRVLVRGVYLRRMDIEVLRSACEAEGRSLEAEVTRLLEEMVAKARQQDQKGE